MRAFTLLELIMVLFILALTIGMATPSLRSMKKDRDLAAASQVTASACNYARSMAVTTGRRTRIGLDQEASRIHLMVEENPMTDPGTFNRKRWPIGLSGTLPKGIRIDQVFYPVGGEDQDEDPTRKKDSSSRSRDTESEEQTEEEAMEERQSVLVYEPDGSTRDTFIYLTVGDATPSVESASGESRAQTDIYTIAIVGAIGTSVIVPRYTEEIFDVYDPEIKK